MDDAVHDGMEGECPECGRELSGDEKFCPGCACDLTSVHPSNCPECGYDLSGDERYCPGCGHDLDRGASSATAASDSGPDRRDALKYGAGFMSAAALGGAGWWITNGESSPDKNPGSLVTTTPTPTDPVSKGSSIETPSATPTEPSTATPTESSDEFTATANSVVYEERFEDGDVSDWEIPDDTIWRAETERPYSGDFSGFLHQVPSTGLGPAVTIFESGKEIQKFTFYWQESVEQGGWGIHLFDSEDEYVIGAGSANPQWFYYRDNEAFYSGDGYDRWIKYDFEFDWSNHLVEIRGKDLKTESTASTGMIDLFYGKNISKIILGHGLTGNDNNR